MKAFLVLTLMLCHFCKAQIHSTSLPAPTVEKEEATEGQTSRTEAGFDEGEELQLDIWAELRYLRDLVVEQKVELRHLAARLAAAESLVVALQKENKATEARMTAAERSVENLQAESDAQATEFAVADQKLSIMRRSLILNDLRVTELEKLQTVNKLAFSTSLLDSGENNTGSIEFTPLIYRNVLTNVGNHYNRYTGHFTAPMKGAYYFTFTGHASHTAANMRLRLVKNGQPMVFSGDYHTTDTDPEDSASNAAVLELEVGDVVSVHLSGEVWDDQYHRTTFSGFLLFPL